MAGSAPSRTSLTPNRPPVATDDLTVFEGRSYSGGTLLGNDSDPDGDPILVTAHTAPAEGDLVVAQDGRFMFLPPQQRAGTYTFEYTVSDGRGGTDTATSTIQVEEGWGPLRFLPALSVEDRYTATAGEALVVDAASGALANDVSLLTIQFAFVITDPTQGTLVFGEDGSFVYTPDPGATGTDTFTYTVLAGGTTSGETTVTIEIEPPDALETVVLGRGSDTIEYEGGQLALVGFDLRTGGERTSDAVSFELGGRTVEINTVVDLLEAVWAIEHDGDSGTDAIVGGDDLAFVVSRGEDGSVDEALVLDGILQGPLRADRLAFYLGADRANTTPGESDAIGPYFQTDLALV